MRNILSSVAVGGVVLMAAAWIVGGEVSDPEALVILVATFTGVLGTLFFLEDRHPTELPPRGRR
jgi:hypothetical protein